MNENKKTPSKIIILSVIFAAVFFAVAVMILAPQYIKYRVKQSNGAEFKEGLYTIEYLEENYGIKGFKEEDVDWLKGAKRYYYPGKKTQTADYLTFYIFKSGSAAKKGLAQFKEVNFEEDNIVRDGTRFVEGWLSGVMDADVMVYVFQTGNMLISCEAVYPDSYSDEYTPEKVREMNRATEERYLEKKNYIDRHFR